MAMSITKSKGTDLRLARESRVSFSSVNSVVTWLLIFEIQIIYLVYTPSLGLFDSQGVNY